MFMPLSWRFLSSAAQLPNKTRADETVRAELKQHQYDLLTDGKVFFSETMHAVRPSFLLGELHGENEIPALLRELWPAMWRERVLRSLSCFEWLPAYCLG